MRSLLLRAAPRTLLWRHWTATRKACTHITSALISMVRETEVYQDLDVGVRHGRTIKSERLWHRTAEKATRASTGLWRNSLWDQTRVRVVRDALSMRIRMRKNSQLKLPACAYCSIIYVPPSRQERYISFVNQRIKFWLLFVFAPESMPFHQYCIYFSKMRHMIPKSDEWEAKEKA